MKPSPMQRRAAEAGDTDPSLLPYSSVLPNIDIADDDISKFNFEYSTFNKDTDFVVGGPLGEAMKESLFADRGRWFADWHDALAWAKAKYGDRLKGRKPSGPGDTYQWAVIVRKAANGGQ